MKAFNARNYNKGPEAQIQKDIICMLRNKGWYVKVMHGNAYQHGVPDLYATHPLLRARWIEVKNKEKYEFTPAQIVEFPLLCAHGAGVWVLTAATENEYKKLFEECNWASYLKLWEL